MTLKNQEVKEFSDALEGLSLFELLFYPERKQEHLTYFKYWAKEFAEQVQDSAEIHLSEAESQLSSQLLSALRRLPPPVPPKRGPANTPLSDTEKQRNKCHKALYFFAKKVLSRDETSDFLIPREALQGLLQLFLFACGGEQTKKFPEIRTQLFFKSDAEKINHWLQGEPLQKPSDTFLKTQERWQHPGIEEYGGDEITLLTVEFLMRTGQAFNWSSNEVVNLYFKLKDLSSKVTEDESPLIHQFMSFSSALAVKPNKKSDVERDKYHFFLSLCDSMSALYLAKHTDISLPQIAFATEWFPLLCKTHSLKEKKLEQCHFLVSLMDRLIAGENIRTEQIVEGLEILKDLSEIEDFKNSSLAAMLGEMKNIFIEAIISKSAELIKKIGELEESWDRNEIKKSLELLKKVFNDAGTDLVNSSNILKSWKGFSERIVGEYERKLDDQNEASRNRYSLSSEDSLIAVKSQKVTQYREEMLSLLKSAISENGNQLDLLVHLRFQFSIDPDINRQRRSSFRVTEQTDSFSRLQKSAKKSMDFLQLLETLREKETNFYPQLFKALLSSKSSEQFDENLSKIMRNLLMNFTRNHEAMKLLKMFYVLRKNMSHFMENANTSSGSGHSDSSDEEGSEKGNFQNKNFFKSKYFSHADVDAHAVIGLLRRLEIKQNLIDKLEAPLTTRLVSAVRGVVSSRASRDSKSIDNISIESGNPVFVDPDSNTSKINYKL